MNLFTKIVTSIWWYLFWFTYSLFFLIVNWGSPLHVALFAPLVGLWGMLIAGELRYRRRQARQHYWIEEELAVIRQAAYDEHWNSNWSPSADEIANMKEEK